MKDKIPEEIIATLAKTNNFSKKFYKDLSEFEDPKIGFDLLQFRAIQSFVDSANSVLSVAFFFEHYALVVPPGEPYTDLERMFMMFDLETWIAVIATLLIGLVAIQIIKQFSRKVQDFVFGRNIRSPVMNLFSIFLTGGQTRRPGRNFSRFQFTMFTVWCLIIRTCYQSMLFEYLQADLRKPEIKTFEELYEKNFTLYQDFPIQEEFKFMEEVYDKKVEIFEILHPF